VLVGEHAGGSAGSITGAVAVAVAGPLGCGAVAVGRAKTRFGSSLQSARRNPVTIGIHSCTGLYCFANQNAAN
jgi:hypothetical protein